MAYSNILIAVDGSKYSLNAAQRGIELAEQLSASVTLLCVIDVSGIVTNAAGGMIDAEVFTVYADEAKKIVDDIEKKYQYNKIEKLTIEGVPTEVIWKTARSRKSDLIIMGTHGRRGLNHLFMGSVAEYVVRHSKIPVMVVPMPLGK
jgi:nucleotide-binding universal stress UspA family protein